jgi:hypothetical protein
MTPTHAPPSAASREHAVGLKAHLRLLAIGRTTYRVISLRAATRARFSTNRYHDTWHILTDGAGARVLGRLMFGLAYQRHPNTLVFLGGDHLVTTPFDADRAMPIALVPDELTKVDAAVLSMVREKSSRVPPACTVRIHTFGLPAEEAFGDFRRYRFRETERLYGRERMDSLGGCVVYRAPQRVLSARGVQVYRMQNAWRAGTSEYIFLADRWHRNQRGVDGEVQVFPDFGDRVSAAQFARRKVLGADRPLRGEAERFSVYDATEAQLAVLRRAKRGAT